MFGGTAVILRHSSTSAMVQKIKEYQVYENFIFNHFGTLTRPTVYHCTQLGYLACYSPRRHYLAEAYLQVTAVILTPFHLKLLADSADLQQGDLHSLKVVETSASPLTLHITERFKQKVKAYGYN